MMAVDLSAPLLAIDTSTAFLSVALQTVAGEQYLTHFEAGNRQAEYLLPEIGKLFQAASITAADLAAVVVAQGPGAFTGLRIGAGVAQGLAAPFATPLIAVPCLDAVAYQMQAECVLAATDARMGEVFYAWFDTVGHRRLGPYQVGQAAAIVAPPVEGGGAVVGVGNAFALDEPPPFAGYPSMPTAADYLALAVSGRYPAVAAADISLLYVRDKIALTAQEQAARKSVQAA